MKRVLAAVIVSLFATAASAQDAFVIERIEAVTKRSPAIIEAETRLIAGRSYTTAQIEQAVYRVRRLPFVVDASYALEPGTSPAARVLRITVADEQRFHYTFDVETVARRGGYALITAGAGLRFFPGSTGVIDLSIGGVGASSGGGRGSADFGDLVAQYTMYNVGGTRAFVGLGASRNYSGGLLSPVVLIGVPITRTQTVVATYRRSGEADDNNSNATAEWEYQTTDDPYFARRGLDLSAGAQHQRLHSKRAFNVGTPREFRIDSTINTRAWLAGAAKYWPYREHSTFFARGNVAVGRDTGEVNGQPRVPSDFRRGGAIVGAAHNFDRWRGQERSHRLRLEIGAGYHVDWNEQGQFTSDRGGPQLFVGLTHRSTFGVLSLGVSFVSESE